MTNGVHIKVFTEVFYLLHGILLTFDSLKNDEICGLLCVVYAKKEIPLSMYLFHASLKENFLKGSNVKHKIVFKIPTQVNWTPSKVRSSHGGI